MSASVHRTSSTVAERGRTEPRDLVVVERSAGGEPEQRRGPEEIVEQLRGREHRPHPLERRADLLGGAHPLTHRPRVDGVAGARREGIEQRLLDEATRRVVLMSAAESQRGRCAVTSRRRPVTT